MVVGFRGNVVVLDSVFPGENDLSGFDLSVFDVDFVSDENNGNSIADSGDILVPFGNVLISNSGANVEHNDGAVGSDAN